MTYKAHTAAVPGGDPITIYGLTDNINFFLSTDLEPNAEQGVSNVQVQNPGGKRRQYPGDASLVNYSGSSRVVLRDPDTRRGSALPGRPFVLREITEYNEDGFPVIGEVRQFHLKGTIRDLHSFLVGNVASDVQLVSSRGRKYTIKVDGGG
jgi:hypothetical protein